MYVHCREWLWDWGKRLFADYFNGEIWCDNRMMFYTIFTPLIRICLSREIHERHIISIMFGIKTIFALAEVLLSFGSVFLREFHQIRKRNNPQILFRMEKINPAATDLGKRSACISLVRKFKQDNVGKFAAPAESCDSRENCERWKRKGFAEGGGKERWESIANGTDGAWGNCISISKCLISYCFSSFFFPSTKKKFFFPEERKRRNQWIIRRIRRPSLPEEFSIYG